MPAPKASFFDYAAVAFGVVAASQVGYFFDYLYRHNPGFFGFLLAIILAPAAIAGILLAISYRKEIRSDPAAPVAALLTVAATLYIASLPFIFAGFDLFAYHLMMEWKLYVLCVAAIVFADQKFFPINSRLYRAIHRALLPLLPEKPPGVRNPAPPAAPIKPRASPTAPPPVRKPQRPAH